MRFRSVLFVASAAVLLIASAQASYAQRGGGRATTGMVKSVDSAGKSFVVTTGRAGGQQRDVTIKTDDQTHYMRGADNGAFADVKEGKYAIVLGQGTPDTGVTAREVFVLEKQGGSATGAVKSVDAAGKSFIITTGRPGGQQREVTVKVNDKTKFFNGRESGKWEDVAAEKRVMIIGEGNNREGFTAIAVRILPAGAGGGQ
jgi:hypothetical protein